MYVPAAVGVPESTPLVLKVNPVGKVPAVVANVLVPVPPVAAIV